MVIRTLRKAFCKTLQKHAHLTFVTLQMLGVKREVVSSKRLKIRVSLVRFQSRPPVKNRRSNLLLRFFYVLTHHLIHPRRRHTLAAHVPSSTDVLAL